MDLSLGSNLFAVAAVLFVVTVPLGSAPDGRLLRSEPFGRPIRHREARSAAAIQPSAGGLDCFASARNDGLGRVQARFIAF